MYRPFTFRNISVCMYIIRVIDPEMSTFPVTGVSLKMRYCVTFRMLLLHR